MPKVDYAALANEARGGGSDAPMDYGALAEQSRTLYDPKRKPVSAEDFVKPSTGWPAKLGDIGLGALKGLGSTAAGIAETAVNAGAIPGVLPAAFSPEMRSPLFTRAEEATTAANTDQRIGKGLETAAELAVPAFEVGKAGLSMAKAVPRLLGKAGPVAVEVASHIPVIGGPIRLARTASKVLGRVLDLAGKEAPAAANTGGRLVKGSKLTDEQALVNALEELRGGPTAPAAPIARPTSPLPPDRTGHFTLPKPKAMLNDAQIEDFLTRHGGTGPAAGPVAVPPRAAAPPPVRVTAPPEPSLPPGYKPRTTAPKLKAVKPKALQAEIDKAPRKRAYFLKPIEESAAVVDDIEPTGSITPEDLPASWRSHTGQDIFPTTGAEGKELAEALRAELQDRGVSVGEAMAQVSKNRSIPTRERTQLIRALSQSYSQR